MPTAQFSRSSTRVTRLGITACALFVAASAFLEGQSPAPGAQQPDAPQEPVQVNGVFPHLSVVSEHDPRSEAGIGALIPWADRLWAVGYVAHIKGSGPGLYEIDAQLRMRKHPASVTGTFANRLVHDASVRAIIGPHIIDADGNVRTFDDLAKLRLAATMEHLADPKNKVYFLTMEGLFFEANVHTLETKQLFDLVKVLELPDDVAPHFKSAFTSAGRVVVANNSYREAEHLGTRQAGRLAEWDGRQWTIIERKPFVEVAGKTWAREEFGSPIYATGWDRASVLLELFVKDRWHTYRLPRGSNAYDHAWNTEWMRIREAQTERYLMDVHGLFYELPSLTYEGKLWGIQPIARHLRLVPDFCSFRGLLVLAGDQTDRSVGQPQSGLWMGHLDELWRWGKPQGWGGPWWEDRVEAGAVSDPYLMTGFDKKVLHLTQDGAATVSFSVEVDFLGNGTWQPYRTFTVSDDGYVHHEFPDGFSAHWVRIRVDQAATVTAQFVYS